ncbi:LOW QUALITY PROTEIN: coiled-coil domain-containing protein 66-like [Haliotis rubra]|uniref:LOW QUALITY PROTEIN: coiled-coil domain-containing protein 66-like n=1 Tax=Haliotis rubra TaxID=36100 RepID=UPI001EE59435|nr:LOW QUALITY PROTEIN: coiled-coil domain-containing protein 66-like [Haliotis rubra]
MSFGSSMRFEVGGQAGKPAIFWDQGKKPNKTRKFGYKSKDMRHPIRSNPNDGDPFEEEVYVYRHDNTTSKPDMVNATADKKPPNPPRPEKDFIRRNRERYAEKKKKQANDVKVEHPMANTVTLTQDQLNAILASVGKMASGKENALRISIDKDNNEISIADAETEKTDQQKASPREEDKEKKEEGSIFSLLNASKKDDGQVSSRKLRAGHVSPRRRDGRRQHRRRDDDASESVLSVKEKGRKSQGGKSNKSDKKVVESESGDSQGKEKSDVTKSDDAKGDNHEAKGDNKEDKQEGGDHVLFYESPRVPWKHMTVAEKKRLQWARERAELVQNYDPWGRPGAGAPLRTSGGDVLADFNTRKDELNKSVENLPEKKQTAAATDTHQTVADSKQTPHQTVRDTKQTPTADKSKDKVGQDRGGAHSILEGKVVLAGFVIDEDKVLTAKQSEKKKWLEELERQREEQRLKKQKSKERDKAGLDDTWADRFGSYKPAPLPEQETVVLVIDKRSSHLESSSAPDIADSQPAAVRSSFKVGKATPSDEKILKDKQDEKRRWLQDLEKQMEENKARKLRDKERDAEAETWADRFTQNINQSALDNSDLQDTIGRVSDLQNTVGRVSDLQNNVGRVSDLPDNGGRVSSAPQVSARDADDMSYLRGQNVMIDPITRKELELKKEKYVHHQEALRMQIEEKERRKREERERKMREEMEEEMKMKSERDNLQNQFDNEQQKIRQKEEARQRRINELKMAMDEAQEKAQQEKLIKKMEHLRQGGHDISHLKAHLDEPDARQSVLSDLSDPVVSARSLPAMSPRVQQVEPVHVPSLNLTSRQSHDSSNTKYGLPEISSRTVDLPHPVVGSHDPYTENRVLTPSRYRHPSQPPRPDPSSPRREIGTQTLGQEEVMRERQAEKTKKVRVISAKKEDKAELKRGRQRERVAKEHQGDKTKWNYQNPKLRRNVKQSERDPFYEKKRQRSEERRKKRGKELLALVELNKPIIPDQVGSNRSRGPSPNKEGYSPRNEYDTKYRSLSPDRQNVKRRNNNSLSPHRSQERMRGGQSPGRRRSPSPPIPTLRTNEVSGLSPPVPALRHKRDVGRGTQVLRLDNGYENSYDNDQYSYSNYNPPASDRKSKQGHYLDRNPIEAPVDGGDFVPFTRTTEILDPARAVEPMQLSRENSKIKKGRKAYVENHNPGSYGRSVENLHDKTDKNDPILNPDLVKGHPTARQDMILQQLSTLKKSLMQKRREVETCMSPSDLER